LSSVGTRSSVHTSSITQYGH